MLAGVARSSIKHANSYSFSPSPLGSNFAAPPGNGAMALTHQGSSFSDGGSSAGSGNSGHQGPHPLPVRGNSARMLMMGGAAGGGELATVGMHEERGSGRVEGVGRGCVLCKNAWG